MLVLVSPVSTTFSALILMLMRRKEKTGLPILNIYGMNTGFFYPSRK